MGTSGMDVEDEIPLSKKYEIFEESRIVRERQEKALQELLTKRRVAALAVPTNDMAVRDRLRKLDEPITLFGEREMERRDHLRMLLDAQGQLEKPMNAHDEDQQAAPSEEEDIQYPFYIEGSKALFDARVEIAKYSFVKSALRLHRARRNMDVEVDCALKLSRSLVLDCSEIGDTRPISGCSLSHDGTMLATCSMSGTAKLWSMPRVQKVYTLKGHT